MVPAAGVLAAAILVAAALVTGPGCMTHERPETGKPPEGRVRVPEAASVKARREAAARDEESGKTAPAVAATAVLAVRTTGIYHRAECMVLAESAPETQVTYSSPWAAIEADQTPCSHCRPGP